jgi:hypothetical protein
MLEQHSKEIPNQQAVVYALSQLRDLSSAGGAMTAARTLL